MEFHLKAVGLIMIVLAAVHIIFPRYFDWKVELGSLSVINRQMMYVHTLFIALTVFLMGILCLGYSSEIAGTFLGKRIAIGCGIFWLVRLLVQFFGYSSELWKGKKFETFIHILFALLWTYFTALFFITGFR